ncbi:Phosphate regulon transcriptional regulatory protein PhoB [Paenibacillus plantiphilus]|uniref:Phosphate regulon transcriptional regulatory protein PhoB n=1 Tax=Paenibacillus plantiphilus TaxID=2905650 RepID=A0ABN8GU23_9BACL|nr:response regulator transcription factor [Paenibacillus plantiphilus]CAH1213377.1 Phosphate regulon transcriptional regulatory protein PhoB [Paenibacillus plantiphilus]
MERILVVDDDPQIREVIRTHIEQSGMHALEAESGRQAIEQLESEQVDIIILDLMMDDRDGFEVLRYLHTRRLDIMTIVVSARRQEQDKITTLGLGADDYMTKPFSPMELMARIQAVLRRRYPKSSHSSLVLRLSPMILDIDNYTLLIYNEKISLTMIECGLMQLFMQNPDRVMTKIEIYQQVWQHERYDDNNLSVYISRLRKQLEQAQSSWEIQTVRGVGYRLTGAGI